MLCVKFGWNSPGGFGEDDKNLKSLQLQRRQRRQQQRWQKRTSFDKKKLTWAFGSGELKSVMSMQWCNKALRYVEISVLLKGVLDKNNIKRLQFVLNPINNNRRNVFSLRKDVI